MDTVHESSVEASRIERGDAGFDRRQLGAAAGASDLGCSLIEVDPGKHTYPHHYHTANEEGFYVLDGEGELRGPDDEVVDLVPGLYAAFPTGPDGAHQVRNTGDEPLRLLAISTMVDPDVVVYTDSDKIGVYAGAAPGGDRDERIVTKYFRQGDDVDYWEGEE